MEFRCSRCREIKPAEAFGSFPTKKRDCYCKPCRAEYGREHYLRNKTRYVELAGARTKRLKIERMEWLLEFFAKHPCVDCGEDDVQVLEFDHLGGKEFEISEGMRDRAWTKVIAEIEKCEVVCANCHRRRTARRGEWMRFKVGSRQPHQAHLF